MTHRWIRLCGALLAAASLGCGSNDGSPSPGIDAGSDAGSVDAEAEADADAAADAPAEATSIPCKSFQTACDGQCVDLTSDPQNCGACAHACPGGPHASAACTVSDCSLVCDTGWTDCDHNPANGCEANFQTDVDNCGNCGAACPIPPNSSSPTCVAASCGVGACNPGFADCNLSAGDGCEAHLADDPLNCGACSNACASGQCTNGMCTCVSPAVSCGGVCVNLQTDLSNCGSCGHACGAQQGCTSGVCTCPYNYSLCSGSCLYTYGDAQNCGACGHACATGQSCNGGACSCPSTTPDLCSTGCVDLQNDPNNCGTCGHACTGSTGACAAGRCVVPPVTLASGQTNPYALALDATYVYWVNDTYGGSVMRMPKAGGGVTTLVQGEAQPFALAIDATNVYFTDADSAVKKVPLAGGTSTVLATQPAYGLALSGSTLLVGSGDIEAIPTSGGSLTLLSTGQNSPQALATDGTKVYWITTSGTVASVPIAGGTTSTLATGQSGNAGIAVDASNVYWTTSGGGTVVSVPVGGGGITTIASGQTNPTGIAVAGGYVYWTNDANPGAVMKAPIGGGTPTALASGQNSPIGIAVDDTYVYWVDYYGGTVMRTAR